MMSRRETPFSLLIQSLETKFPHLNRQDFKIELKGFRSSQDSGTLVGYSVDSLTAALSEILAVKNSRQVVTPGPPPGLEHAAQETCAICKDTDMTLDRTVVSCGHEFHSQCLRRWLKESSTCPVCRSHSLMSDDFPQLL